MKYDFVQRELDFINENANFNDTQQEIFNRLTDKLATTRDELSNARQTATLVEAINGQTATILNSIGRYVTNPPCYQSCGCNGLY